MTKTLNKVLKSDIKQFELPKYINKDMKENQLQY